MPSYEKWRQDDQAQLDQVVTLNKELASIHGDVQVQDVVNRIQDAHWDVDVLELHRHSVVVVVLPAVRVGLFAVAIYLHPGELGLGLNCVVSCCFDLCLHL